MYQKLGLASSRVCGIWTSIKKKILFHKQGMKFPLKKIAAASFSNSRHLRFLKEYLETIFSRLWCHGVIQAFLFVWISLVTLSLIWKIFSIFIDFSVYQLVRMPVFPCLTYSCTQWYILLVISHQYIFPLNFKQFRSSIKKKAVSCLLKLFSLAYSLKILSLILK